MAATSLAEQLQRLAVPQSTLFKEDKKKASLLFDPKEAALKDRDTFYEIGRNGLNELITLNEGFRIFEGSLFSPLSKEFERAVQSKTINRNLDETVEKFLLQLSPYLLIQSSHKCLEWLVNRYHIHQYNQDAIMALILPYHHTKIFVRFIQLMSLDSKMWSWLKPLQKPGIPLAKQVLYNHCSSNPAVLQFIGKTTVRYVNEFGDRANQLNTVFAFYSSTVIGTLDIRKHPSEAMINMLLPSVMHALTSNIDDFRSSAYVIFGFLSTKASLKEDLINDVIEKILNSEFVVSCEMILLTNLIYTTQTHLKRVSDSILYSLTLDIMSQLCLHLREMIKQNIDVSVFVIKFLSSVLPAAQSDTEEFKRLARLPEMLIEEVNFKTQKPEKIIKCIFDSYQVSTTKESDGNESDLEIIEEEQDMISEHIVEWYSSLLKSLENKYPDAFDSIIKQALGSKSTLSDKKRADYSKLLGFKPAVSHKVGGSSLFENLNHSEPRFRVEGVNYLAEHFQEIKAENLEFLKESLVNRLNDDNAEVVKRALDIPAKYLKDILNESDITNVFVNIVSRDLKNFKKWKPVINTAIEKLCSLDALPVNQDTVLAVMPHLFPYNEKSALVTYNIITSVWGKKFNLTKNIKGLSEIVAKDNHELLCQTIFNKLFVKSSENFDEILNIDTLNKNSTLDICFFLLLKSFSFKKVSIEEINSVLSLLLDSVENREIVGLSNESEDGKNKFNCDATPELVNLARQDKILFEFMEYIFKKMIDDTNFNVIPKPWCNFCKSTETVLVRRLFEIFVTGCFIDTYSNNYAKLLQKLLDKFCSNKKEKFEFIANFACGHILYASDPKDVIGPELQLRSLQLLYKYVLAQTDHKWIYDSDVVLLMFLFNLNNPLSFIRHLTIEMIEQILKAKANNQHTYWKLLNELYQHKEELRMDHEQLPLVLKTALIEGSSLDKKIKRACLLKFMSYIVLVGDIPAHITSEFLNVLSHINNTYVFSHIAPVLHSTMEMVFSNDVNPEATFDVYESKLLRNVIARIDKDTVATFEKDHIWNTIAVAMTKYRECVLDEDHSYVSPSVLIMRQVNEDLFKNIPQGRATMLVELICSAGAFSNNPKVSSMASKTMRKIHLELSQFKPILEKMMNVQEPETNITKKKKPTVSMLSYHVTETPEWKLGITLLEYVQSKKKMSVDSSIVFILFQILNKCLRFEEQSYVEYTKQLILSSLWYYCHKFVDDKNKEHMKSLKSIFNIELIVQCIRGTQNPQTHHHALILLSHAASMLPEQVLHHTMEIFTFMGSSVLRHDDAYSFQIIVKIIETLIPILVKLDKSVEEHNDIELQQLQCRVVPVLRIFADVVLHVPEHRRLPLYKKLIETLNPSSFLWVFLALLLETHVAHSKDDKIKEKGPKRSLADQESPMNRPDFGQDILLEFPPEIGLENLVKLIGYVKSLPTQKDEDAMEIEIDSGDIFSVNGHTALQLRHYKYVLILFMNSCMSSSRFVHHTSLATDISTMETHYKTFIINVLTFIQRISKESDEKTAKYWRVMLHHSYDLLDNANNLLSVNMFLSVVRGLLKYTLHTVRRKAMELLNNKIQHSPEFFKDCDKELLFSLLPALLDIVKTIEDDSNGLSEMAAQELELNQQSALLSLKLLTRMLATENPHEFKPVLETVTNYLCNHNISGNVMASVVLCLAELCSNLKAYALDNLPKFMTALIKVLKKQRKADTPELILLTTVTAIAKIIESVPLFLSPYLLKILYEYSVLLAKWQSFDQDCAKVSAIVSKLLNIKKKIASSIAPRVLIPVVNETHQLLLEKEKFDAVGPVMSVLAESFANVTPADFHALQHDLSAFFLSALQLRSDAAAQDVPSVVIDQAEDEVVNALVCLVLKLSESKFRPFYFKIYDWAIRSNVEGQKDRVITFYRLSSAIAVKLKGLFVLFAGHFIKNAAELLDACNKSKTEELYFESDEKCTSLVNFILKTLNVVFLYDSQNFINKEKFETLMQPVVDQLENTLGGIPGLKTRAAEVLIPCISQFAVATADDSLWKLLNYQILLKTRHNDAEIRLTALDCLVAMASQLGTSWLPLLAESVPFLAELLEDGDPKIEVATKDAIRKLETILEEPLEKYF